MSDQNLAPESEMSLENTPPAVDEVKADAPDDTMPVADAATDDTRPDDASTELALRQQELELAKASEHVTYLQESLSAMSTTGAELAMLLNHKSNMYRALLDGLRELMASYSIDDIAADFIDASGYYVVSEAEDEKSEYGAGGDGIRETGATVVIPSMAELPADVVSLLGKVEHLARTVDSDREGRDQLEATVAEREAELRDLTQETAALRTRIENKLDELSEKDEELTAKNEKISVLGSRILEVVGQLESLLSEGEEEAQQDDESNVGSEEDTKPDDTGMLARLSAVTQGIRTLVQNQQESLHTLTSQLDGTRGELEMNLAVTKDASAKLNIREAELSELRSKAKELHAKLDEVDAVAAMRELNLVVDGADASEDEPASELDNVSVRIDALVQALQKKDSLIADSKNAADQLQQRLDAVQAATETLERETREIDEMTTRLEEMLSATLSDEERAALKQSVEAQQQDANASGSSRRVGTMAAVIAAAVSALRKREKTVSVAGEENTTLQTKLANLEEQLQQRNSEKQSLETDLSSIQEEADSLRSDRNAFDAERQTLADKLTELQTEYEIERTVGAERLSQVEELSERLAEFRKKAGELDAQLRSALAEASEGVQDADEATAAGEAAERQADDIASLATAVTAMIALLRSRNETVKNSEASIVALQDQASLLDTQKSTLIADLDNIKQSLVDTESDRAELQVVVDRLRTEKEASDTSAASLKNQLDELKQSLTVAGEEKQALSAQVSQLTQEQEHAAADYEAKIAERASEVEKLKQAADESAKQVVVVQEALRSAEARVADLQTELSQLQVTAEEQDAKNIEYVAEISSLQEKVAQYESELALTAEERDALIDISDIRMVTVPGTWQGASDIRCDAWDPSCTRSRLRRRRDGTYRATFQVPPGEYQAKVAINGSWSENYGARGERDGQPLSFIVDDSGKVTFAYDPDSKILTIV